MRDQDERIRLFREVDRLLVAERCALLPMRYEATMLLHRPWVHGLRPTPLLVPSTPLEALELAQQLGDLRSEHFAVHFLADCPLIRGECVNAEEYYRRALELALALGDRSETAVEMQGMAMAAAGRSQPRRALRLAGAATAELEALGIDLSGLSFWNELLERYLGKARHELGPDAASAEWREGRMIGFERAVEEALAAEVDR